MSSYPTRMTGNFTSVIFWALPIQGAMVLGTKVPWHLVHGPSSLSYLCTQAPSRISTVPAGTVFQIQWLLWHTPAEARALLLRHRTPTSLMHLWPLFSGVLPGSRTWVPTAQRHAEPLKKSRESPFSLRKASLPITSSNNSASSTIPLLPSTSSGTSIFSDAPPFLKTKAGVSLKATPPSFPPTQLLLDIALCFSG